MKISQKWNNKNGKIEASEAWQEWSMTVGDLIYDAANFEGILLTNGKHGKSLELEYDVVGVHEKLKNIIVVEG